MGSHEHCHLRRPRNRPDDVNRPPAYILLQNQNTRAAIVVRIFLNDYCVVNARKHLRREYIVFVEFVISVAGNAYCSTCDKHLHCCKRIAHL